MTIYSEIRTCTCGSSFTPRPEATGRNRYRCNACNAKAAMVYRQNNPETVKRTECTRGAHPERAAAVARWSRRSKLRSRYGLTLEQYDEMWRKQNGVCIICKKPETAASSRPNPHMGGRKIRSLAVDHSHATKKVRGLLCMNCNRAIGFLQESFELAHRLADYLHNNGQLVP